MRRLPGVLFYGVRAYRLFSDQPERRAAVKLLTRDETWRIAANIAKLPHGAAEPRASIDPTSGMTSTTDISPDCAH